MLWRPARSLLAARKSRAPQIKTNHEITERRLILNHVFRALRPEGRLVIVDRERSADSKSGAHEVALQDATADTQAAAFHIIQTDPTLLTDPDGEVWWLIVAEKW